MQCFQNWYFQLNFNFLYWHVFIQLFFYFFIVPLGKFSFHQGFEGAIDSQNQWLKNVCHVSRIRTNNMQFSFIFCLRGSIIWPLKTSRISSICCPSPTPTPSLDYLQLTYGLIISSSNWRDSSVLLKWFRFALKLNDLGKLNFEILCWIFHHILVA